LIFGSKRSVFSTGTRVALQSTPNGCWQPLAYPLPRVLHQIPPRENVCDVFVHVWVVRVTSMWCKGEAEPRKPRGGGRPELAGVGNYIRVKFPWLRRSVPSNLAFFAHGRKFIFVIFMLFCKEGVLNVY
jgi:hypothetical protein